MSGVDTCGETIMKPIVTSGRVFAAGFLYLITLAVCSPLQAAGEDDVVKVVYHADFTDPRRFSAMLASIHNMVTYYEDQLLDYDVRVVFNSHGIRFVTADPLEGTPFAADAALEERRDNLKGRLLSLHEVAGVKLELCEITRVAVDLDPDKLYPEVERVPSGVVQIADLQRQGFSYLKVE
jgi:intracellular sulfur oxidation DsrE/DsrF family protein